MTEYLGMYGGNPKVQIGNLTITRQSSGKLWMERNSGPAESEGGEFSEDKLWEVLDKFYEEHF